MGEREFNELYHTAIKKIAVGFYILDNCGGRLGYDAEIINRNKKALCGILAEGINLSIATIFYDVSTVQLPSDYISQLKQSGLLEDLIEAMEFEFKKLEN